MGERIDRVCVSGPYEFVDPDGNYCRSEDVAALEADVARLKERLPRVEHGHPEGLDVCDECIGTGRIRPNTRSRYAVLEHENKRLREALEKVISAVRRSRKGSLGALGNVYCCQLDVEWIDKQAKALGGGA